MMHTADIQLRWGDIDQYQHVNNVRYAQFMEDARVLLMHQPIADFAPEHPDAQRSIWDLLRPNLVAFIGSQQIEYREPIEYSTQPVQVCMGVSHIGGSSYDIAYSIEAQGRVKAIAEATCVVVDKATGKPARISAELKSVLQALACEPAPFRTRRKSA